jgi:thymidylate synthase ThyX
MIRWLSDEVELHSRLGRVGSARPFDLWQFRESVEQAVEGVAQIASLSYGNEEAKNPQKLFDRIIEKQHLSCLEFIPFTNYHHEHLPLASARNQLDICGENGLDEYSHHFSMEAADKGRAERPATGLLVEAPIMVVRQWFRHRAFSELEMSRRYVNGSKVPFTFYGVDLDSDISRILAMTHEFAVQSYDKLIELNCPAELARTVIGTGAMTRFFVAGYNRNWRGSFVKLRSDLHAQPEIRVFSDFIKEVVK